MLLCRATYPGRSSLRDDPRGIFFGTLQSRDHKTLLADRRTSSHSQLRMYPGCILKEDKTEDSELNGESLSLSLSLYTQSVWREGLSQTVSACKDIYIKQEITASTFPFSDTLHCFSFLIRSGCPSRSRV